MNGTPRVIVLTEYQKQSFGKFEFSEDVINSIHHSYSNQINIETPSFLNDHNWILNSKGWVGYIPASDQMHFSLLPKVPIFNLFRMLEYAYRLDFQIHDELISAKSLQDVYERLASILAKRVMARIRKGLYRAYLGEEEALPFVRGRIDISSHLKRPYKVNLPCSYEEHTSDLEDNQILLWTLSRILKSGVCSDKSIQHLRQARRGLLSFSSLKLFSPSECVNRLYNRLNQDYESLHALCRFFLENTGPTYLAGNNRMLPILVDMDQLFEMFVAEWLKINLPPKFAIRAQESIQFASESPISIRIDITIEDIDTGSTALILDTKYKTVVSPSASDIEQVVAYAEAKSCPKAALVYPEKIERNLNLVWGKVIEVKSVAFPLDGDINENGTHFMNDLLRWIE